MCPPAAPLHLRGALGCLGPLWGCVSASPALNFVAEAALAARGHPRGGGGKGPHGGCTAPAGGVPWDPRAHEAVGLWGTAGFGCRSFAPRCDRVRAAAWGLFLALHHFYSSRCRLGASLTAARARSRARTPVCPSTSPNPYSPPRPRAHRPGQPRGPPATLAPHQGSGRRCPVAEPRCGELPAPAGCRCTQGSRGGLHFTPPPKLLERSYGGFCTAQR